MDKTAQGKKDTPENTVKSRTAGMLISQELFFSPDGATREFSLVLHDVQAYISGKYSVLITDGGTEEVKAQVKRYIAKYVQDYRLSVAGMTQVQLVDALYTEMAEFSFLTKYIFGAGIEEIDINAWNDIEVQYSSGIAKKLEERFDSPEHAINVVRRIPSEQLCLEAIFRIQKINLRRIKLQVHWN